MALSIGPQLRAARAMAKLDQDKLAGLAAVSPGTVRRLEAMEGTLRATLPVIQRLQHVLEEAGVVFTNGDEPGVRLRKRAPTAA